MFNPASGSRWFKQPVFRVAVVLPFLLIAIALNTGSVVRAQTPAPERPVFDVPRVDGIKIDGKFDDWGDKGLIVHTMITEYGEHLDPKVISGEFRLAWDDRGLIVGIRTHDSLWFEEPSATALWHRDSVELFVADKVGSLNYQQVYIAPGMAADQPKLRHHTIDFNLAARNGSTPTLEAERIAVTPNDYTMEVLYPWSNLGLKPHLGDEVGFQIFINDVRDQNSQFRSQKHLVFYPAIMTYNNPMRMHRLRLSTTPSPPILAAASGPEFPKAPLDLKILVDPSLAGKTIELVDGDTILGSSSIPTATDAQIVPMTIAQPPLDKLHHWFNFRVDGVIVGHYRLGDQDRGLVDPVFNSAARDAVDKQGGYVGDPTGAPVPPTVASVKKPDDPKAVSWTLIIGSVVLVILLAGSGYAVYRAKRLSPLDI